MSCYFLVGYRKGSIKEIDFSFLFNNQMFKFTLCVYQNNSYMTATLKNEKIVEIFLSRLKFIEKS